MLVLRSPLLQVSRRVESLENVFLLQMLPVHINQNEAISLLFLNSFKFRHIVFLLEWVQAAEDTTVSILHVCFSFV